MIPSHDKYRHALRVIQEKIDEQSNDDTLWDAPIRRRRTIQEEALTKALRDLHDVIERFTIPLFEKVTLAIPENMIN